MIEGRGLRTPPLAPSSRRLRSMKNLGRHDDHGRSPRQDPAGGDATRDLRGGRRPPDLLHRQGPEEGPRLLAAGVFLTPAMLFVAIGFVYPAIRTSFLAFQDSSGDWSLDNFIWMFTQPAAIRTLINTSSGWRSRRISTVIGLAYAVSSTSRAVRSTTRSSCSCPSRSPSSGRASSGASSTSTDRRRRPDRPAERDRGRVRRRTGAVVADRPDQHHPPHRHHDLDPDRIRDGAAQHRHQGRPHRADRGDCNSTARTPGNGS